MRNGNREEELRRFVHNGETDLGVRVPQEGPIFPGLIFPGQGYPPNPGQDRPGLSPFGRLAKGNALGKTTTLLYDAALSNDVQTADTEMLRVEGDDLDACQLIVTLGPPSVQAIAFDDLDIAVSSNPSLAQTNFEVTTNNFPGSGAPIKFPPLEAIVHWGVGGAQFQAIVDYVNGVAFSVCASFLSVIAVVSQGAAENVQGTSAAYILKANVGPGWTKGNARRTVFLGALANTTESAVMTVPQFASRVLPIGCVNTAVPAIANGFIRFWQSPAGQASGTCVGSFSWNSNQPFPIDVPAGGLYFSIYNQSGVAINAAAAFELALG